MSSDYSSINGRNVDDGTWDPEAILESMEWEARIDGDGDTVNYAATAERVLRENAPYAAQVMRHLALYSQNEKMRFEAAREILNRVLGRPDANAMVDEHNDPLANLTGKFIRDAEDYANVTTSNAGDTGSANEPESDED